MNWAWWTVTALAAYALLGAVFAVAFVARGAARLDPAAASTSLGWKLLVLPGAAALWPLLARRWLGRRPPPTERNAHRRAAGDVA